MESKLIDVWQISPHTDSDFDCAVFDNVDDAGLFLTELLLQFADTSTTGDEITITVKQSEMTRHDYEETAL